MDSYKKVIASLWPEQRSKNDEIDGILILLVWYQIKNLMRSGNLVEHTENQGFVSILLPLLDKDRWLVEIGRKLDYSHFEDPHLANILDIDIESGLTWNKIETSFSSLLCPHPFVSYISGTLVLIPGFLRVLSP